MSSPETEKSAPKVSFVSLGCPKALVDSERIVTRLRAEGYELARQHAGSDLVIVNTCGFLDSAKAESLQAIGSALKENGKVIVTGCMGAEPEQVSAQYPDVLAITGPQQYESVLEAVHHAVPPQHDPFLDLVPPQGIKLTPRHYAYLKISEGCNNRCSFCIIPKLRGDLVSRPAADVLREAEKLAAAGVKELLVISQDTSAYGLDLKYAPSRWKDREVRARFIDLARELGDLGIWVRLHYVYPYPHVDEVIPMMAEHKVLPYLDIPFQHASSEVLRRMKRPAAQERTLERIARWREICPDLTLRSTFIVGFPGEADSDFQELYDFVNEARFDWMGVFEYSDVDNAASYPLDGKVDPETIAERRKRLMALQRRISREKLRTYRGCTEIALVEGPSKDNPLVWEARLESMAPDIDGKLYLTDIELPDGRIAAPGDVVAVEITKTDAYDLIGRVTAIRPRPAIRERSPLPASPPAEKLTRIPTGAPLRVLG